VLVTASVIVVRPALSSISPSPVRISPGIMIVPRRSLSRAAQPQRAPKR
jgi:hypothetical protein